MEIYRIFTKKTKRDDGTTGFVEKILFQKIGLHANFGIYENVPARYNIIIAHRIDKKKYKYVMYNIRDGVLQTVVRARACG